MVEHGHDTGHAEDERVTSPMQRYTTSQAMTGAVVTLVGLLLVFGIPLLFV